MADIAMAPYVNRLAALSLAALWEHGRLPRVARWFENVRARPTFAPAFFDWLPAELAAEMRANGRASWPAVAALLGVAPHPGDTSSD
jgi:glutathione S-transferase